MNCVQLLVRFSFQPVALRPPLAFDFGSSCLKQRFDAALQPTLLNFQLAPHVFAHLVKLPPQPFYFVEHSKHLLARRVEQQRVLSLERVVVLFGFEHELAQHGGLTLQVFV